MLVSFFLFFSPYTVYRYCSWSERGLHMVAVLPLVWMWFTPRYKCMTGKERVGLLQGTNGLWLKWRVLVYSKMKMCDSKRRELVYSRWKCIVWLKKRVLVYSMIMYYVIQKRELVYSKCKCFVWLKRRVLVLEVGERESCVSTSSWKLLWKNAYYCKFRSTGGAYGSSVLMEWHMWWIKIVQHFWGRRGEG